MSEGVIRGGVCVIGDYVSADVLLPARFSFVPTEEMAQNLLMDLSEEANAAARTYPIMIAGYAFGYGTGRESPMRALRAAGIKVVIGGPFARMFFRNAINNGVLVIDCEPITKIGLVNGDTIEVDTEENEIRAKGQVFRIPPIPDAVRRIIEAGSLIDYGRQLVRANSSGVSDAPAHSG